MKKHKPLSEKMEHTIDQFTVLFHTISILDRAMEIAVEQKCTKDIIRIAEAMLEVNDRYVSVLLMPQKGEQDDGQQAGHYL